MAPRGFDDYDLRLGDIMRGERATLGRSLLDVQRDLKIRASYIAAIENCDVAAFETPGFVAGYVRSYARYLGMDHEWAWERFCEEAGFQPVDGLSASASGRRSAAERPLPRVGNGAGRGGARLGGSGLGGPGLGRDRQLGGRFAVRDEPWLGRLNPGALGSVSVLLVLTGALGWGVWTVVEEVQRVQVAPVDATPGVLAELDPLSGVGTPQAAEAPDLAAVASDRPERMYRPPALDVPVMVARDGPIATIDPNDTGVLADVAARSREVDSVAAAVERTLAGLDGPDGDGSPRVQVSEAGPPRVEILAVRPAWVRVQSSDGAVLFERILDAGERYEVPALEAPARLRAGNSGAVYFLVDGEPFGPAAPGANIARNVDLSPDALRDSFAVADLSRDPDLARITEVAEAAAD